MILGVLHSDIVKTSFSDAHLAHFVQKPVRVHILLAYHVNSNLITKVTYDTVNTCFYNFYLVSVVSKCGVHILPVLQCVRDMALFLVYS